MNLSEYSEMTYSPARGSNSVGQSSVLIKRRSRVQVPPAPPISGELTDDQLENVIGGAPAEVFNLWCIEMVNEGKLI